MRSCLRQLQVIRDRQLRGGNGPQYVSRYMPGKSEALAAICCFLAFVLTHWSPVCFSLFAVWVYSTVSILVISLCGLLGVAVIPVMGKSYYHQLLQFLVALAVGTLCGDALIHLLPHVSSHLLKYVKILHSSHFHLFFHLLHGKF
jgi:hypothetical protein